MVCENDILEIPEEYKKMSEEELDKEISFKEVDFATSF